MAKNLRAINSNPVERAVGEYIAAEMISRRV